MMLTLVRCDIKHLSVFQCYFAIDLPLLKHLQLKHVRIFSRSLLLERFGLRILD